MSEPVATRPVPYLEVEPMDHDEAKVIETHLGQTTILEPAVRVSHSPRGGSKSIGMHSHQRPLMFADEIRSIREDQVFVSVLGRRPMLVDRGPEEMAV